MERYVRRNFIPVANSTCLRMLDMPDCIALSDTGGCKWLNIARCQGINCSFKQTRKERQNSLQCWKLRLASLDKSEQNRIAEKYYGGKIFWNE